MKSIPHYSLSMNRLEISYSFSQQPYDEESAKVLKKSRSGTKAEACTGEYSMWKTNKFFSLYLRTWPQPHSFIHSTNVS
jgi:hypothetical protein